MSVYDYFNYPKWAFPPGKKHATIYISDAQPADVVTYGTRNVQKRDLPIVKFSGFSEAENADALSLTRLSKAMFMMINHAAKSCRLPAIHTGSIQNGHVMHEVVEGGQKYYLFAVPIFMRVTEDRQRFINLRVWKGGEATHSAVVTIPQIIFYDVPTMAQFERVCSYAAELARAQRP